MRKVLFWVCMLLAWLSGEVALDETALDDKSGQCPPGKYRWGWCRNCPGGRYCPGDGKNYQCPPGLYARGSARSCSRCPRGQTSHGYGWRTCKKCPGRHPCRVPPSSLPWALRRTIEYGAKWTKSIYQSYPRFGLKFFKGYHGNGATTRVVVGYSTALKKIIVYFRGTANARNVAQDLDAVHMNIRDCRKCSVHRGFYIAHKSLRGKALPQVRYLKRKFPRAGVTVMGHSLGGAMAVHECWSLKKAGINCELITYGAPRTGNQYFANYINRLLGQHWRIVWRKDPVTALPPANGFRYYHDGTEINFESSNKFTIQPYFFDRIWNRPNPYNTYDHLRYDRINI